MISRLARRLTEWWHLKNDMGAPASAQRNGLCVEPHCRWPYHSHELFDPSARDKFQRCCGARWPRHEVWCGS